MTAAFGAFISGLAPSPEALSGGIAQLLDRCEAALSAPEDWLGLAGSGTRVVGAAFRLHEEATQPILLAAALAATELGRTATVAERAKATILGCEIGTRLERTASSGATRRGFDVLGWGAAAAAAAAGASLLRMSATSAGAAIGMALSLGAGVAVGTSDQRRLAFARGVDAGVTAAKLVADGFGGVADGVEATEGGFLSAVAGISPPPGELTAHLGVEWAADPVIREHWGRGGSVSMGPRHG